MSFSEPAGGIALLCDIDGTVRQVIRDELGATEKLSLGRPLTLWVDRASRQKALNFLVEVRAREAVFDWELNVPLDDGHIITLHFAGGVTNGELLIIGAKSRNGVLQLYEDMMRISNEQVNTLRSTTKEQIELTQAQADRDRLLYDEISRLNNELVTLQRQLAKQNAEQESLNRELRRVNQLKNTFLGVAAHDLRGPLANIHLASQFMLDEGDSLAREEHEQLLHDISKQSQYMTNLIAELLDIAQIEAGKLELNKAALDAANFLAEAVRRHANIAEAKGTEILLKDVAGGTVLADPFRLQQVIDNLISNAVKFSPPGSTVEVSSRQTGAGWQVSVLDEGPGVREADRERLFQEFARLSARPTGGESSTGLGLAISRRIVEAHGGQIGVDSEPGHGADFWFILPPEDENG